MHNYDPINKYSMNKKWKLDEQWDSEETKRKQYMRRKDQGISVVTEKSKILMRSLQFASLTYSRDGYPRFGDHVMLFNGKVQGFLVTDVFERLLNTGEFYNVSVIKKIHACSRSVKLMMICRADLNDGYKDNVIHQGQRIRIRINPLLIDNQIYLYSQPASVNRYSKVSLLQQVILMLKNNFNTVWFLEHPDYNIRLEMTGTRVVVDDSILIKHEMT